MELELLIFYNNNNNYKQIGYLALRGKFLFVEDESV